MISAIKLGSRVRLWNDNGWGSPGCVMSISGDRLRVYWPDENVFTRERPADLLPYGMECPSQEVAA